MAYFEDLKVWQEARALTKNVYCALSVCRDFGFKDQIQRAAVSVMNNIAEGSESGSDASFIKFLKISKGSCAEVRSMLYLCLDLNYINNDMFVQLKEQTLFISRSINKLIISVRQKDIV